MQTESIPKTSDSWPAWVGFLHRHGLEEAAVWALESLGPLAVIGAQALYFSKPLIETSIQGGKIMPLAQLLEDSSERQAFIDHLRVERIS